MCYLSVSVSPRVVGIGRSPPALRSGDMCESCIFELLFMVYPNCKIMSIIRIFKKIIVQKFFTFSSSSARISHSYIFCSSSRCFFCKSIINSGSDALAGLSSCVSISEISLLKFFHCIFGSFHVFFGFLLDFFAQFFSGFISLLTS